MTEKTKYSRLFGVTGKARSGKDTFAQRVADETDSKLYAFAGPLKAAAATAFGIPQEHFYDADKKEEINPEWGISPRDIAQRFGTECMRNVFFEDFWIRRAITSLKASYATNFIITDVRFENEADFIRKNNGTLIHIERPSLGDGVVLEHASEAGVAFEDGDFVIVNDGTLEEFNQEITNMIDFLKII